MIVKHCSTTCLPAYGHCQLQSFSLVEKKLLQRCALKWFIRSFILVCLFAVLSQRIWKRFSCKNIFAIFITSFSMTVDFQYLFRFSILSRFINQFLIHKPCLFYLINYFNTTSLLAYPFKCFPFLLSFINIYDWVSEPPYLLYTFCFSMQEEFEGDYYRLRCPLALI